MNPYSSSSVPSVGQSSGNPRGQVFSFDHLNNPFNQLIIPQVPAISPSLPTPFFSNLAIGQSFSSNTHKRARPASESDEVTRRTSKIFKPNSSEKSISSSQPITISRANEQQLENIEQSIRKQIASMAEGSYSVTFQGAVKNGLNDVLQNDLESAFTIDECFEKLLLLLQYAQRIQQNAITIHTVPDDKRQEKIEKMFLTVVIEFIENSFESFAITDIAAFVQRVLKDCLVSISTKELMINHFFPKVYIAVKEQGDDLSFKELLACANLFVGHENYKEMLQIAAHARLTQYKKGIIDKRAFNLSNFKVLLDDLSPIIGNMDLQVEHVLESTGDSKLLKEILEQESDPLAVVYPEEEYELDDEPVPLSSEQKDLIAFWRLRDAFELIATLQNDVVYDSLELVPLKASYNAIVEQLLLPPMTIQINASNDTILTALLNLEECGRNGSPSQKEAASAVLLNEIISNEKASDVVLSLFQRLESAIVEGNHRAFMQYLEQIKKKVL